MNNLFPNNSNGSQLCNSSEDRWSLWEQVESGVVFVILIMIIIITVTGNIFIIACIAYFKKLQTPTNIFILSLATADFFVGILVMPFSMIRTADKWYFGEIFCKIHSMLDLAFCAASIFSLCCIAFDRYLAVCDPLKYCYRMSKRRISILLLICWTLPTLISCVPILFDLNIIGFEEFLEGLDPCSCVLVFNIPYAIVTSSTCFIIPILIMIGNYGRIFQVANVQARQIHAMENRVTIQNVSPERTSQGSNMKKERKAAKTLGKIIGIFLGCWLPFFTTIIIHPVTGYTADSIISEVVLWLGYTNSAINPFLYAFYNKPFRHAFLIITECKTFDRNCQNPDLSVPTSRPQNE
uniref:G-protein coupled receptors family 1 profile domain-containing protein n=2 Tax=Latimeria chalumnae TaxID=7897 RepID=H3AWX3_LATCH